MSSQPPSIEQYGANKKQLCFALSGELTSKVGTIIDEFTNQFSLMKKQLEDTQAENKKLKEMVDKKKLASDSITLNNPDSKTEPKK